MRSDSTPSKRVQRECLYCGKSILVYASRVSKGNGKFCNLRCAGLMQVGHASLADRLWVNVQKTETCWLWTGKLNGGGYGTISRNRKPDGVHRIAWELANGPIPEGLQILHSCDVPNCVRNDGVNSHLHLGTQSQNMAEMADRGHHADSRLTPELADQVRARYAEGGIYQRQLAQELGVAQTTISAVVLRKTWNRH